MDFKDQVKSAVDIVKLVGDYGVRLKKMGSGGRYTGLCPFHQEKSPSFQVHAPHQFYYCFGCQATGDIFKFVQEMDHVTFFEALKILAERNGVPMPKRAEFTDPQAKLRGSLYDMHEIAAAHFRKNLFGPAGGEARAYLTKRGLNQSQVEEFGLGLALDSWDQLTRRLQEERFPAEQLEESGLVAKRDNGGFYDRFRARLMFPIHNEAGKIIAFGGRALKPGEEAKYLNSPETPLYRKNTVLFNLHRAKDAIRKTEHVILVEGYMDVIGVYSAGVHEVVASCGTALNNQQVRVLKKHSDKVVVNFDSDNAGANATEKSLEKLLEEGLRVRVLELHGGKDPDEYIKQNGPDVYRENLAKAPGYFHWLADRARKKFDVRTSEGKIAGLQFLLPAIQRVTDKLERATIAEEVASYLGIERGLVLDQFRKIAADKGAAAPAGRQTASVPATEKLLVNCLLQSPEARERVLPKLSGLQVYGKLVSRPILEALAGAIEGKTSFDFSDLEGRLTDRERDLLATVVFADEMSEDSHALDQASRCLQALEEQDRELSNSSLRERIKAAERSGNIAEAMRLMKEFDAASVKRKR
jgi:DNA primase